MVPGTVGLGGLCSRHVIIILLERRFDFLKQLL